MDDRHGGECARLKGQSIWRPARSSGQHISIWKRNLTVSPDKSVSGSITISGMDATAAHIHEGAAGKTGPVIIPLSKGSDDTWSVLAGAKLTDAQYKSYLAGDLYSTCTVPRTRAVKYERS
jgi:hypothetical protein